MGFPDSEFEARTRRAQTLMAENDLAALLLTTEPDVRYFSGFLTRFWESPTRPWFLIVPATGRPVAVIPSIGVHLMGATFLDDIRAWPAPRPEDDGVSLLAKTLNELTGGAGRVGVPMGHETHLRMPLGDYARLRDTAQLLRFVDATAVLQTCQRVKSEAEIALIAKTCAAAGDAFDTVSEIAAAGRPLSAVFRDFQIALLRAGADWVPYLAGGAGPGGYADVISPAADRPLQAGDVLMLDTGAAIGGYFCDFDRNFAIGHAADDTRRAYDLLYAATEAGLEAAMPGATAADLFAAMHKVIARAGDAGDTGRLGHGLGMRLTEWPSLTASDTTVLEPGMVLTLEPGLQIGPGRTMVHEEDIVIREDGPQLLTRRAPADLPVIA